MTTITFNGQQHKVKTNQTVLNTLLLANVSIPNACQEGVCQSCLMRSLDASPPALAQKGLKIPCDFKSTSLRVAVTQNRT